MFSIGSPLPIDSSVARCTFASGLIQARRSQEKVDSLAEDVKPLVLELLRQVRGLTARLSELVAQNEALLVRIAEFEAEHGKPPKTPDNSSLPPSRGQKGNLASPSLIRGCAVRDRSRRHHLPIAIQGVLEGCLRGWAPAARSRRQHDRNASAPP
jgi:hypothetical protein